MSAFVRETWVERKVSTAKRLAAGECGGSYSEAVLIVCAAISALAAEAWPGEGKDKRRFVELLIMLTPVAKTISVPLLVHELADERRHGYARRLQREFLPPYGSRVVSGPDVDRPERELRRLCRGLTIVEVRRYSYASLLYERLRSPMVHEYRTGARTVS